MTPRLRKYVVAQLLVVFVLFGIAVAGNRNPLDLGDTLVAISTGNLPTNDDRLLEMIRQDLRNVAGNTREPTARIEAAARRAQDAVSEVTAAYTAAIFQSSSVDDAQRVFRRFQDTVGRIVQFARRGDFLR